MRRQEVGIVCFLAVYFCETVDLQALQIHLKTF